MGKRQKVQREFQYLSTIGFASCVLGTYEIFLTTNTSGLRDGGLAGLFWSLIWTYIGQSFVVLSLAEMASMAPTAGGQHYYVSGMPRNGRKFCSIFSTLNFCFGSDIPGRRVCTPTMAAPTIVLFRLDVSDIVAERGYC